MKGCSVIVSRVLKNFHFDHFKSLGEAMRSFRKIIKIPSIFTESCGKGPLDRINAPMSQSGCNMRTLVGFYVGDWLKRLWSLDKLYCSINTTEITPCGSLYARECYGGVVLKTKHCRGVYGSFE